MPTRIRAHPIGYPITPRVNKTELEFTLGKLLKGAGAGADPTEIDVSGGITEGERALLFATL